MTRTRRMLAFAIAGACAVLAGERSANADPMPDPENARVLLEAARRDGDYTFCEAPKRALSPRQAGLCPLAAEVPGCEALARACREGRVADDDAKKKEDPSSALAALASFARLLVWGLAGIAIAAALYPLVALFLRSRRDKQLREPTLAPPEVVVTGREKATPARVDDAEEALRVADEHVARGELATAMSLYLAASLVALDRRGAIRLARHRTNGEYVRLCDEADAKPALREIVREVDRIEFGKARPTADIANAVGARAKKVVRSAVAMTMTALVVLLSVGCSGQGTRSRGSDPAGDDLPRDILRRAGYRVGLLGSSLSTLPMPRSAATAPVVFVDMTHIPLDDEAEAHLLRFASTGGIVAFVGAPETWPRSLGHTPGVATSRELTIVGSADDVPQPVDPQDPNAASAPRGSGAHVAAIHAFVWPESEELARLGDARYAARKRHGTGWVVGIGGIDLFTNLGSAIPANAVALVGLVNAAQAPTQEESLERLLAGDPGTLHELRFARVEDAIPPPSSPFASLAQAGLGRGLWHALAFAGVLFLAYGIRRARPHTTSAKPRRAFAEHVEATAAFYGRARAMGHALASYGLYVEASLRNRAPRGADHAAFLAARTGRPEEDVKRLLDRAREAKASDPPRGDELRVIRDLRALLVKALG